MDDIRAGLNLARRQGVLAPIRIARILAGEGSGQFSSDDAAPHHGSSEAPIHNKKTVPLEVALDYVGTILEESRKESFRLKDEIEEYNALCNTMEQEIDALVRASYNLPPPSRETDPVVAKATSRLSIDETFTRVRSNESAATGMGSISETTMTSTAATTTVGQRLSEPAREAFWREIHQSDDGFEAIARYFAKGIIN